MLAVVSMKRSYLFDRILKHVSSAFLINPRGFEKFWEPIFFFGLFMSDFPFAISEAGVRAQAVLQAGRLGVGSAQLSADVTLDSPHQPKLTCTDPRVVTRKGGGP